MNRPIGTVGQGDTPAAWFQSLPLVTKTFLVGGVVLGGATSFGLVVPAQIHFEPNRILKNFELWRIITPFLFVGPFSFPFLMHMMALYENCMRYEASPFNTGGGGTTADFIYMLFLGALVFFAIGYFMPIPFFGECMLFMIMYVWSRKEPNGVLNIFGFKFQALYLPWIYLAIRLLMGSSIVNPLIGIVVGHAYFFLADVLPISHNIDLIHTPSFLIHFVDRITGVSRPIGANAAAARPGVNPQAFGGHNWGRGNRLGAQ